ncbi:transposase [Streptomyces mirabilis]|uniref:transposase n=1 Tax=Streptomyces mirabilis TaxID=68239 RepID=UPI0036DBAA7C
MQSHPELFQHSCRQFTGLFGPLLRRRQDYEIVAVPHQRLQPATFDPDWKARYAVRSGVESTVNDLAHGHGHGMRRCRYGGQQKAHLQHVFTAIAVNIERLSGLPPTGEDRPPRRPTAFQNFLDRHGIPRHKSWRTASS